MKGAASALAQRIGRRGAALLFFAKLDLVYAFALLNAPHPLSPTYQWAEIVLPLWAWAALWAGVGVVCLIGAFMRYDSISYTAAIAIKIAWGGLALFGWLAGVLDRGYVSTAVWFGFAGLVYLIAGGIPTGVRLERRRKR